MLATVVSLLEETLCRVGNESYVQANNSFGMTTLRNRHVTIKGGELRFSFKGKGGKEWRLRVKNPRVAKVVRACHELPGQRLFEYRTGDGSVQPVDSGDVNTYLRETSGQSVSAKDFRTWFGTVEAAVALETFRAAGEAPRKRHVNAAVKRAPTGSATPSPSAARATSIRPCWRTTATAASGCRRCGASRAG